MALIEKDIGYSIKVLRIDQSGEYNSHEFIDFYATYRIKRQLIITYNP